MSKTKKGSLEVKDKSREFKTKASILMNIACGKSHLTTKNLNSFFFLDDYQRFLNYKINSNPGVIISKVKNLDEIAETPLESQNNEKKDVDPSKDNEKSKSQKETVVSFIKHANGRMVNSIYHKTTKRPSNLETFVSHHKITDVSLYHYITSEHVEELNLENCSHLSDNIFKSIGSFCPNLKILNLFKCVQLTNLNILQLVQKPTGCVKNLVCLNLSAIPKITDVGLKYVFQNCVHLKVLSIHSNPQLTGTSFQYLKSKHWKNRIELLDISYCSKLKPLSFMCIAENLEELRHFNCAGTSINDDCLIRIIHNCYKLETLRLMLCVNLTHESLCKTTEFLNELEILELTGCLNAVTDKTIKSIAYFGENLILLSLNGCRKITDKSTEYISRYCKNLRVLELSNCKNIRCDGLIKLIHEVKHLRIITLNGTSISQSEVKILGKVSKRCRIIKNDGGSLQMSNKESGKGKKKFVTLIRV